MFSSLVSFFTLILAYVILGLGKAMQQVGVAPTVALGTATQISDLWSPSVWIQGVEEQSTVQPSLINSGIVQRSPLFDEVASGGGTKADMPFLKEPNYADEIQVQATKPTINNISSGKQVAPILNRVSATGHEALAGAVAATDPVGFATSVLGRVRLRQQQTTLLNVVRGGFGNAAAAGAGSAALKTLRNDIFLETTAGQTSANLFSSGAFIDTTTIFGEVKEKLTRGAVVCHSIIEAAMLKQQDITFLKSAEGDIILRLYKGIPLFISDLLVRNGTTSGKVYDTYIFMPGAVGLGQKAQSSNVGDVAALTLKADAAPNTIEIYDRTRLVMHLMGLAWGGTPAGNSATNSELATEGNWSLAYADIKNCGVCCLRTNG